MCLAIAKQAGILPNWKYLETGFKKNPDGAGFAIARRGRVEIHKGFFTFSAFRQAFEPFAKRAAAIHFRYATHGKVDQRNCHPFSIVHGKLAMIHNGVLNICTKSDPTWSDTYHYAESVLRPLARCDIAFARRPHMKFLGEAAIGSNKMVFLDSRGRFTIWNEKMGVRDGNVWYSNTGYKPPAVVHERITGLFRESIWDSLPDKIDPPEFDHRDCWNSLDPDQRGHWRDLEDIHGYEAQELADLCLSDGPGALEECNKWHTEDLNTKESV